MTTYRIVRRAFSQYTDVETFEGSWLGAMQRADKLQATNRDGEYLLRKPGEPNQSFESSYVQSGFDYL